MTNRRSNLSWTKKLAEAQPRPTPKVLTAEQLAAQKQAQRDARVNSVMRSGFSQRNRV
jgi:hypothetical protein